MDVRTRKVLATALGIAFCILGIVIGWDGQYAIAAVADVIMEHSKRPDADFPVPSPNSFFYFFLVVGFCFSSGLAVAAMLWTPRPDYKSRLAAYTILLACLAPASMYNFAHGDYLINPTVQAVLNLFLIFGGALTVQHLFLTPSDATDLRLLQIFAMFLLALTSVLLPGELSLLWFLNQIGAISLKEAESIGIPTLSTIASVGSAIVGYLKFRREATTPEPPSPPPPTQSPIILP